MSCRRTISILLVFCVIAACTKKVTIPKDRIRSTREKIIQAVLVNGDVVRFDAYCGRFLRDQQQIAGVTIDGKGVRLKMEEILSVQVSKVNVPGTVAVIAGAAVGTILIIAAAKESCPFVYSFDGEKYVFDAEPLGGAIASGLQKTDYSRLEHLKPVDGKYRLLFRNEVPETQYTDSVSLLITDHPKNASVVPDIAGNMYVIHQPIPPTSASDENNRSLMKFVASRDDVAWQTKLPEHLNVDRDDLRHHLTFEFQKPSGVKKAKLLINAGTALWGSHMIRAMLELRGNQVDAWYQGVNRHGIEALQLIQFIEREELYLLKVHVREGDSWNQRAFITGQGPFINEDRAIDLDLSNVSGEKVLIRLNPPMGFWAIDSVAITYEDPQTINPIEIAVASTDDQYGKDVSQLIQRQDQTYQVLSQIGDWVKMDFPAPSQKQDTNRTVFLKTSGYYEIHLTKDKPEQTERIQTLMSTPGAIVRYAIQEYQKLGSQTATLR
jgi:hypothetical protein